ncbi:hypothetical protein JCM24511_10166 [Saitozyma sp. JCM 24511]|nr:hypothetical protein JCM24511_10166 [Saitozyma sp. JCM 24511]
MSWTIVLPRPMRVQRRRWLVFTFTIAIVVSVLCLQPRTAKEEGSKGTPVSGRVLITGGGGNIGKPRESRVGRQLTLPGKHLIRRLLAVKVPVTSIDIVFVEAELDAIYREVPEAHSLLRVVFGDIRDEGLLQSAFTPDIVGVINLSAVSQVQWCLENKADCEDVNVRGVARLLEAMTRSGVDPWLIQASSWEVYGSAKSFPVTEDSPLTAANVYGASKARAEEHIGRQVTERKERRGARSLQAIVLRLSNVYGGEFDHRERLVPSMMTQAMAHRPIQVVGGYQSLDMVHIDDAIASFILAANRLDRRRLDSRGFWGFFLRQASSLEVYNVASGDSVPVSELLRKILAITQSSSPVQTIPGDNSLLDRYVGSTEKASAMLGFSPQVDLDQGLHQLATAYMRRTSDYLERKIKEKCPVPLMYNAKDLLKLDGCSGMVATYGPDHNGYLYFRNDPLEFGWRDEEEPQSWSFEMDGTSGEDEDPIFRFLRGEEHFEILEEGQAKGEGESRFRLRLDPATGHVRLLSASTGRPVLGSEDPGKAQQLFRLTPICCANKEGPWPFFQEDPLASAIFDLRDELWRDMSGSRPKALCTRLKSARDTAQKRLDRLASFTWPITPDEAALPTGSPAEWRLRHLPACTNLCDHPTICVDTGSCMCVQSSCPALSRFPFASSANLPVLSYPPPAFDDSQLLEPNILEDQVNRSTWLSVLRPHAARYLARSPQFMQVNVTRLPDDAQNDRDRNPEPYDKLHNNQYGCYSADSALERGLKQISTEYSDGGLVFLPYYHGFSHQGWVFNNEWKVMPHHTLDDWYENARQHYFPPGFDEAMLVIPFAHDWGPCNFWFQTVSEARHHARAARAIQKGSAWSPMGDLNVNCYRPDQDIVIPSRTCLQDRLREQLGSIDQVRPIRQRAILAAFKGSLQGQGTTIRPKITCPRPYQKFDRGNLDSGASMPSYWNSYPEGKDYLQTLNDTVFCPLPPGITDPDCFSGCIPVLIGDQTHHPFWDMLDWSKFSVQISEGELDRLEEILLGYTWSQLQQLQTNLMLVRDAFLYPSEGDMDQHFRVRGPFFFAMHGTALLRQTRYPV